MAQYIQSFPRATLQPAPPRATVPGWRLMLTILASIAVIISLLLTIRPRPAASTVAAALPPQAPAENSAQLSQAAAPVAVAAGQVISPDFSRSVQYWAPQIAVWAETFGLDPNLVATIMQIESCGDPGAISPAGAQGLFQVMPFHFQPGENSLDPETNARRGLAYFVERLEQTSGDVGRALAGYNGGHVAAAASWDQWLPETQRYYTWTTGIYNELRQGGNASPFLQDWVRAGGGGLCRQAEQRLGIH